MVERRHCGGPGPFGDGDDRSVDGPERQVGIATDQFSHPLQVVALQINDRQLTGIRRQGTRLQHPRYASRMRPGSEGSKVAGTHAVEAEGRQGACALDAEIPS